MTGTFKGDMMGIPPTGKKFTLTGIIITRWVGGKEVEAWEALDRLSLMQQLGISPPGG
jgi:predicted ester cyclase